MTFEEKMKALENSIRNSCFDNYCDDCEFCDYDDKFADSETCGIRDSDGNIPWNENWNMNIALGFEEPHKQVFPQEVEESIMKHFTEVN